MVRYKLLVDPIQKHSIDAKVLIETDNNIIRLFIDDPTTGKVIKNTFISDKTLMEQAGIIG